MSKKKEVKRRRTLASSAVTRAIDGTGHKCKTHRCRRMAYVDRDYCYRCYSDRARTVRYTNMTDWKKVSGHAMKVAKSLLEFENSVKRIEHRS